MATIEKTKNLLSEIKGDLRGRFKVKEIGIFGSLVRKEQTKRSDIDLLVDFDKGATLLDLSGLALYLEERLAQKVDIVSKKTLRKEIKHNVLKEVIFL